MPTPSNMKLLARGVNVLPALLELRRHPELWNQFRDRTYTGSVHEGVDDIWVRYADGGVTAGLREHKSIWYPASIVLPNVVKLAMDLFRYAGGTTLGGVLITRIPPGRNVLPHTDTGWHAEHYKKIAIQLESHQQQAFHYEDGSLVTAPGDVFAFCNQPLHWVTNDSPIERITMIVCYTAD